MSGAVSPSGGDATPGPPARKEVDRSLDCCASEGVPAGDDSSAFSSTASSSSGLSSTGAFSSSAGSGAASASGAGPGVGGTSSSSLEGSSLVFFAVSLFFFFFICSTWDQSACWGVLWAVAGGAHALLGGGNLPRLLICVRHCEKLRINRRWGRGFCGVQWRSVVC